MKKYIVIPILLVMIISSLLLYVKLNSQFKANVIVPTEEIIPFKDDRIAVIIDGDPADAFPTTSTYSASIACTSGGTASSVNATITWVTNQWVASISGIKDGNIKCTISFEESIGPVVGNLIAYTPSESATDSPSSWKTSTDGYDATNHSYLLSNTILGLNQTSSPFTKENLQWYVWSYEEGVKLTLLAATPTEDVVRLNYVKSWNNGQFFIDDICSKLYGNDIDGVTARNIKMNDIWEKIFEYKQSATYNNTTVALVDGNGKADLTIPIAATLAKETDMINVVNGLLGITTYGTDISSPNKTAPIALYNFFNSTTIRFSYNQTASNNHRNMDRVLLSAPTTSSTTTRNLNTFRPRRYSFTISNPSSLMDSTSMSMLTSTTDYWINSRDYYFSSTSSGALIDFGYKVWTNNTVDHVLVYQSGKSSGNTVREYHLRPVIELDLTKVQLNSDGTVTAISS